MAAYFLAFFLFTAYFSQLYIPPNQLTVHRGAASMVAVPMPQNRFGFQLKHLDLRRAKPEHVFVFVHGHKGSAKQAISMTQYFEKNDLHLDMYSIDFQEAAVAISAELLHAEAEYLSECLRYLAHIQSGQISIIAHSMGGIVASLALSLPDTPCHRVKNFIALSTPFETAPMNTFLAFPTVYNSIYQFWRGPIGQSIFVLSFTGGIRDLTVPSHITNIEILAKTHGLHLYTTQLEGLFLELDHLAMVWGLEFFPLLSASIKIVLNDLSVSEKRILILEKLNNRLGRALHDPPTESSVNIHIDRALNLSVSDGPTLAESAGKIYRVTDAAQRFVFLGSVMPKVYIRRGGEILGVNSHVTKVDGWNMILVRIRLGEELFFKPLEEVKVQTILEQWGNLSLFWAFFLGYSFPVSLGAPYLIELAPGASFASFHYPLRLKILSENSQIHIVHAKCSSEEILKFNEHDFVLFFHESCPQGPVIWLIGFDPAQQYEVRLSVDWVGMLIVLARDVRMVFISATGLIALIETVDFSTRGKKVGFWLIGIAIFVAGAQLRTLGGLGWDQTHDEEMTMGLVEIGYLYFLGQSMHYTLSRVYKYAYLLVGCFAHRVPRLFFPIWILVSPLGLWFLPWPYVVLSFCISAIYDSAHGSENRPILYLPFLLLIASVPQLVGWTIVYLDHKVLSALNPYDLVTVFPMLLSLLVFNVKKPVVPYPIMAIVAGYLGLCCYDLPYRANAAMAVGLLITSLFTLLKTEKPKVE